MASEAKRCRIEETLGMEGVCPEEPCPFWERGGMAGYGGCAFEKVDLVNHPEIAEWLFQTRKLVETERSA